MMCYLLVGSFCSGWKETFQEIDMAWTCEKMLKTSQNLSLV